MRKSVLMEAIWSLHFDPGKDVVQIRVSRPCAKLDRVAWALQTEKGVGYRLPAA